MKQINRKKGEKWGYQIGGEFGFLFLDDIGDGDDGPRSTVEIQFGRRIKAEFAGGSEER